MKYGWSFAEDEGFRGDFESRELAVAHAVAIDPERTVVYTGERHDKKAEDFVNVDNYLEDMQIAADDQAGEASMDWLPPWNTKNIVDHAAKEKLGEMIAAFVDLHWPVKFWVVDKIERHEVTK